MIGVLKHLLGWDEAEYLARRDIIHENKNEALKSIASARTLRKASDEALRVARCAIKTFENTHNRRSVNDGG